MLRYEFKVVPAPRKGDKTRGLKTAEDRFAQTLATLMNQLGREGWDYLRADTLPMDERSGLTGTKTTYQNVLVFRRVLDEANAVAPALLAKPEDTPGMPRLGPAEVPAGTAPALGPASQSLAAE
jgi:hypothetical protein